MQWKLITNSSKRGDDMCIEKSAMFELRADEVRAMMADKISSNAEAVAKYAAAAAESSDADEAALFQGRIQQLSEENQEIAFARDHLGAGPFTMTGEHLNRIRCDLRPTTVDIEAIRANLKQERQYRTAGAMVGKLAEDCEPMLFRRW